MKGLIQRVTEAGVNVDGEEIASINRGLLLLLGIERGDEVKQAKDLCRRIVTYRVFPDAQDRMNLSLSDIGGELLVVPQFTLAADTASGTRPGFSPAARPDVANDLYQAFLAEARNLMGEGHVGEGRFGADMAVRLINDGPVTFMLDTGGK